MKNMGMLCISFSGLIMLSACNDGNDTASSSMVPRAEITDVVNRAVITAPENSSPVDVDGMSVLAPDNTEPVTR